MKTILFTLLLCLSSYAEVEQGKIDMHGGKESYSSKEKSDFRNSSMGISTFLDSNTTKKTKPTQK